MACNCFKEVGDRMKARVIDTLGKEIHTMDDCDFEGRVFVIAEGDHSPVWLNYRVRYYQRKKNGERAARLTNADTKIAVNFCPFCGTKFEGTKKKEG